VIITAGADSVNDEGTDLLDARECSSRTHDGSVIYKGINAECNRQEYRKKRKRRESGESVGVSRPFSSRDMSDEGKPRGPSGHCWPERRAQREIQLPFGYPLAGLGFLDRRSFFLVEF
jgi:hypothetical protein